MTGVMSWQEFRDGRADQVAMDDACRDLVLAGYAPGRERIRDGVLRGQIPPEAGELIASALGRAALAKRALEVSDITTAEAHVESAEALALQADAIRTEAVKRRFAELKRRHLEERKQAARAARRALTAAARQTEAKRRALARAEAQRIREEEAARAWIALMNKVSLPDAGPEGRLG